MIEIVPSILSQTIEDAQAKLNLCEGVVSAVHLDVIDGNFVKNITFSLDELNKLKTSCTFRVHLMVSDPLLFAQKLVGRVNSLFFHYEAVKNSEAIVDTLHPHFHVGVAINIETPARVLFSYLNKIDFVLIMAVPTGFSGGKFNPEVLKKSLQLKTLRPDISIGVDGGVSLKTAGVIKQYPVDFVTPASALFAAPDFKKAYEELRKALS